MLIGLRTLCSLRNPQRHTRVTPRWSGSRMDPLLTQTAASWYTPAPTFGARVQAAPAQQQQQLFQQLTHHMQQQQQQQQQPHLLQQPGNNPDMSTTSDESSDSEAGPVRVPLKLVVQDAVKRWFDETLSEARRGDVKQQALLAQMYTEGYGCKQDLEQAQIWAERAKSRGYQMAGVYCSAP